MQKWPQTPACWPSESSPGPTPGVGRGFTVTEQTCALYKNIQNNNQFQQRNHYLPPQHFKMLWGSYNWYRQSRMSNVTTWICDFKECCTRCTPCNFDVSCFFKMLFLIWKNNKPKKIRCWVKNLMILVERMLGCLTCIYFSFLYRFFKQKNRLLHIWGLVGAEVWAMLARHDRQPALPLFLLEGGSLPSGKLEGLQMSRDGLWKVKVIGCEARVNEVLLNKFGVYIFLNWLDRWLLVLFC